MLIRELDQSRHENMNTEDEQIRLMEQIAVTERDVAASNGELAELRNACSSHDMANLNLRKECEYTDKLVMEQKDVNSRNFQELTRLKEVLFNLEKDCEAQQKRVEILHVEVNNNEQRTASI